MLIATLPPVHRDDLLREIIACPSIGGVRYNTGMVSPFSPEETLRMIKTICDQHGKKFWVDLKGRQLRVTKWALPGYGETVINHEVEIDGDAWVCFRDGEKLPLKFAHGNKLYIDSAPRHAVGEGQSLNIIGEHVTIKGYLTETDLQYVQGAQSLGIESFMLSFAERWDDIGEVRSAYRKAGNAPAEPTLDLCLKIESPEGLAFVDSMEANDFNSIGLMAARDDLFIMLNQDATIMMSALRELVRRDPDAIVASRLFTGIERDGTLALSDITDIEFLKQIGYRRFMLSDEICHRNFNAAIKAWDALTPNVHA